MRPVINQPTPPPWVGKMETGVFSESFIKIGGWGWRRGNCFVERNRENQTPSQIFFLELSLSPPKLFRARPDTKEASTAAPIRREAGTLQPRGAGTRLMSPLFLPRCCDLPRVPRPPCAQAALALPLKALEGHLKAITRQMLCGEGSGGFRCVDEGDLSLIKTFACSSRPPRVSA